CARRRSDLPEARPRQGTVSEPRRSAPQRNRGRNLPGKHSWDSINGVRVPTQPAPSSRRASAARGRMLPVELGSQIMGPIPASVAGFIADGRVGRLATAGATGQPHVVPICYAFDGASLFSAIDAKPKTSGPQGLKRIRNIRENPKVSVVIDRYDEDWSRLRYVIIQGQAELLTEGGDFSRGVDLLLAKYPQYRGMGLNREAGLMIKVEPARVTAWHYSS